MSRCVLFRFGELLHFRGGRWCVRQCVCCVCVSSSVGPSVGVGVGSWRMLSAGSLSFSSVGPSVGVGVGSWVLCWILILSFWTLSDL